MLVRTLVGFQNYCLPRHTILTPVSVFGSRRCSSSKRKNVVALKTLNRQNKSLFGALLETKSERRKRITKCLPLNAVNTKVPNSAQEWTAEIKWVEKLGSCKALHVRNTSSNVDNPSLAFSKKKSKLEALMKVAETSDNSCNKILAEPNSQIADKESTLDSDVYEENITKTPAFQLPEIIVRNIPSFPLQNDKKQLSADFSTENILNLSLGEEVDKESHMYPSVSKILNATMSEGSRIALLRWRQKMIADLGQDEFLKYYRGLLTNGSLFHATIQKFLTGMPEGQLNLDPAVEGCWRSLSGVMPHIGSIHALESRVAHSRLKYRGVIDCIAQYQNKPVLIEWKKSDTQKAEIGKTYDAPVQLIAYLGAMNYDARYCFQVRGGLVVVAYSDGSPAHVFPLNVADCNKYWRLWLTRVQQYWQLPTESRSSTEQSIRKL